MASRTLGNIGDISIMLGMNVDQASVTQSLGNIESRIEQSARVTSNAQLAAMEMNVATQTAHNAGRLGTRIQEFGRGFEDFAVSFSMAKTTAEGIAMGLRGSANNAAQLAASFSPIAGAAVAIGASLATIIIPRMEEWLFNSKELEKSAKRHEEALANAGKEQIKRASDIAGFRQGGDKKDDPLSQLEDMEKKRKEALLNTGELRRQLAHAEQELDKTTYDKKMALFEQGEAIRSGDLTEFGRARGRSADAATRGKLAEAARDAIQKELAEKERAVLMAAQTEKEIRERFGDEIARAEMNRRDGVDAKIREEEDKKALEIEKRLDGKNDKAEKDAMKRIDEEYREEQAAIDALKVHSSTTDKLTAANKAARNAAIAKEQERRDVKAFDKQIQAKGEEIDALQERIQKAGNAAGPSAAMMRGTQAAEQVISRAIAGTRSQEDLLKMQLKELEKVNKNLQKQKQNLIASIP